MLSSIKPGDDPSAYAEVAKTISGYQQNNQIETPNPTSLQQRRVDALELAELIYKIYNDNCPVLSSASARKEKGNV